MTSSLLYANQWYGKTMSAHLPVVHRTTAKAVANAMGVRCEPWMQDWPLEVADSGRIEEFLAHYEKEERPEHRLAIAVLITASLDEAFSLAPPPKALLDRVGPVLKAYPQVVE